MTKLTDGKKTVEISMYTRTNGNNDIDFSADFFGVGQLRIDNSKGAYIVPDVDYCIDYANDWAEGIGDFYEPDTKEYDNMRGIERVVDVIEI